MMTTTTRVNPFRSLADHTRALTLSASTLMAAGLLTLMAWWQRRPVAAPEGEASSMMRDAPAAGDPMLAVLFTLGLVLVCLGALAFGALVVAWRSRPRSSLAR